MRARKLRLLKAVRGLKAGEGVARDLVEE